MRYQKAIKDDFKNSFMTTTEMSINLSELAMKCNVQLSAIFCRITRKA